MTRAAASAQVDAEALAAATLVVRGVAALSAGPLGQYRSYLRGRSVVGVRIDDDRVHVDVVVDAERPFPEVAEDIGTALRPLAGGRRVSVGVYDLQPPTVEGYGERG